jgi:hypothetical protein
MMMAAACGWATLMLYRKDIRSRFVGKAATA